MQKMLVPLKSSLFMTVIVMVIIFCIILTWQLSRSLYIFNLVYIDMWRCQSSRIHISSYLAISYSSQLVPMSSRTQGLGLWLGLGYNMTWVQGGFGYELTGV